MSLLEICQKVARVIPLSVPSIIVGSSDSNAMLLLGLAQDEGEALARRISSGWTVQIIEHVFETFSLATTGDVVQSSLIIAGLASTTGVAAGDIATGIGIPANARVASVDSASQVTLAAGFAPTASANATPVSFSRADYALPSDYQRMVDGTLWDRSRFWEMRGAMSPQQWQMYKSSPIGRASIQRRWRIRVPSGSAVGTATKFSIDPVPTDNGSSLVFEYVSNAWCKSASGTPQTSWLADSDVGILDEYLMRLGLKWRVLERLGMDYAAALAEYEGMVDKAVGSDGGAAVLDMTPGGGTFLLNYYNIPESGMGH
jgi:hypothetical protein